MTERAHTGRRRNEAARQAILHAAADLLTTGDRATITVAAIAEHAGVGKQTIYRWWPSKSAVLLDAMMQGADQAAPIPETHDLAEDLRAFLEATFTAAAGHRTLLVGTLHEALGDTDTMTQLTAFVASRRAALSQLLDRARDHGQIRDPRRAALAVDQVFGVLWYRLIFTRERLDDHAARELADALAEQLTT
ncbi:TetR/AcrR family transcriptional regulator [Amycolatopsis sp. NBC_00345]|uniref:TetR/AcrR family transcriptional regulator n=1 Tax=Amycolatopsis sp. NBC_00345 TaxID=2975955 RepID=UPI002E273ADA